MKSASFDLLFFFVSGIACLLLVLPYLWFGDAAIFPIYNMYLVLFGLPHNYLTWATILPKSTRQHFNMEPVYAVAIACAILTILIPLTDGTALNNWILSFISYFSLWHAYRQHHGLCKVYDSVQAKRTGDFTIFKDRKALNLFFGLAANGILVWAFTHSRIKYLLSADEFYDLVYPKVPMRILHLYTAITLLIGVWALKRSVWDRWRRDAFIPWPQLALMSVALATYIVPYFFITINEMPLAVAIGTIYHNLQYFGFVWLFERHRSEELVAAGFPLQLPQRYGFERSWVKYFSIAGVYSFLIVFFYFIAPHQMGLALIYFLGIAHYIIDGYIWKTSHNKMLPAVLNRLAGVPTAPS